MPTGTPETTQELDPAVRDFMRQNASKGGKAGTGESKRRGGKNWKNLYKNLSKKAAIARKKKKRERVNLVAASSRVEFA